ncbi:MAG TPA: hypothetical protein VLK26_09335 [Rudaea sp.]|nr:hypothetical protein [Rudaea sp.]
MKLRNGLFAAAAALLAACSSMSTITAHDPGTRLLVKGKTVDLPVTQSMKGTSFGNYEFKATNGDNAFYGILPLKFKGGHLAADIILFAPAAFFNLRQAFAFYEIDVKDGVIRYKEKAGDPWTEYTPKAEEAAHARNFYEGGAGASHAAAGSH